MIDVVQVGAVAGDDGVRFGWDLCTVMCCAVLYCADFGNEF